MDVVVDSVAPGACDNHQVIVWKDTAQVRYRAVLAVLDSYDQIIVEGKLVVIQQSVQHLGSDLIFGLVGGDPTYCHRYDPARAIQIDQFRQQEQMLVLVSNGDWFVALDNVGVIDKPTVAERGSKRARERGG
jgi:cephalosporin hydroxylase